MTNPLKVLLFLAGGTAIAAVAAYLSGALDPIFQSEPPAAVANVPAIEEQVLHPLIATTLTRMGHIPS